MVRRNSACKGWKTLSEHSMRAEPVHAGFEPRRTGLENACCNAKHRLERAVAPRTLIDRCPRISDLPGHSHHFPEPRPIYA
ncbi:hypothetical protein BN2475_130017 [Paraburkholderia ribeironis]|uniref:Uncharacterized protein n=1 Tax=Paraburkholderia ribeironis TaxID=1247936 RepID=A0A1N7RS50_9BURK|nr:hypothetical protein BN2475_130017 [Paraburkholderia ribeironis]